MPTKSYIEPKDIPIDGLKTLSSALKIIKYGEVSHSEKPEVIVVKESFLLRDKYGQRIGVFTRSPEDHKATLGDCRILVNGDFISSEARRDNYGKVSYAVSARLKEHLGAYSSQFRPVSAGNSVLLDFKNPTNDRRYVFIVFEMVCEDFPPPFHIKLRTRTADAFVGLHDRKTVLMGIKKYNKETTQIDEALIRSMKKGWWQRPTLAPMLTAEGKASLFSGNLTIMKVNLFGIG